MHRLLQRNFTTYDVHRAQDFIGPNTDRKDILLLMATPSVASSLLDPTRNSTRDSEQRYSYARVLGIYHVQAVYVSPGAVDRLPFRINFLFVRHYETQIGAQGWRQQWLEVVQFPTLDSEDAFWHYSPI